MQQRNEDPKTRYEIELECGHVAKRQFPPDGYANGICSECIPPNGTVKRWIAYTDTRLDLRVVRTMPGPTDIERTPQ